MGTMRAEASGELDGMTVRCEVEGTRESAAEGVQDDMHAVARMVRRAAAGVAAALDPQATSP